MAAVPQPAGPVAITAPRAPTLNFTDRYRDVRFDAENDDYRRFLVQFDPMSPHALTAAELWDSVLQEPDDNARAVAVHWQNPALPNDPGRVVVLHGIKRFPRSLSAGVAGRTPWDNQVYAWFEDVLEDGTPPTIFQLPGNIFQIAQPTDGVLTYQVYDGLTLATLFAADAQLSVAPVPGAGSAGTSVIQTRYAFPVPFRYVAGVLCQSTNPREFFELVYPQIVAEGRTAEMEPFVRWMCTACTARHDQLVGQVLSSVAMAAYTVPPADRSLREHRKSLLSSKLPDLLRPAPGGDSGMAHVGGQLIDEMRQARKEARDRASTVTTAAQFYGPLLVKHMRLAQVATEADLPQIHHDMAKQNKHRLNRYLQHECVQTLSSLLGRPHLKLPITPTLSDRLNTASWVSPTLHDLNAGIHTFMLGGSSQVEVQSQEELIALYDMASRAAGATFQDLSMVSTASKTVSIPTNHTFAKFDLQRLELLMILYWGDNEATRAVAQYLEDYEKNLHLLMDYRPQAAGHEALVPGLVLRYFMVHMNHWANQQLMTDRVLAFPADVHKIWTCLEMQDYTWERPFPARYITSAAPLPALAPRVFNEAGALAKSATAVAAAAVSTNTRSRVQGVHRNTYPNDNLAKFLVYRKVMESSGKKFKTVILNATRPVPKNDRGLDMCVSFHVVGNCNTMCSRSGDHHNLDGGLTHTKTEDETLLEWCKANIKVD